MPDETNTSHTDKTLQKNLAGASSLLQGFGVYTHGCASAPPRNSTTNRREESPISKHQPLRVPNGYHRRGSGATIGGSPNNGGKPPFLKNNKTQMNAPRTLKNTLQVVAA
jgi:hypothetical protein